MPRASAAAPWKSSGGGRPLGGACAARRPAQLLRPGTPRAPLRRGGALSGRRAGREEEERRARIAAEEAALAAQREAVERERREAAAALKAAEGDRLLADAAAAVLKGTLHNAEVLLREADAAFVAAGQDEELRELRLRGTRLAMRAAAERKEAEKAAAAERLRVEEEARVALLLRLAREAEEKRVRENAARVREEWFAAAEQGEEKTIERMLEAAEVRCVPSW